MEEGSGSSPTKGGIPTPSVDKLRPISLTSTLSKICEIFFARWVMQDMEENLDPNPYGNRKNLFTTHYLVNLVQFILTEAEGGHHTNLLSIHYSKAFDKIDINVTLDKLLGLHVRLEMLPWLGGFLSSRRQSMRLGQKTSEWTSTTCDVPQGTQVGPVVFLAMVNHVASHSPLRWKYVDDITVGESRRNTAPPHPSDLPQTMNSIYTQASRDHMSLNISKRALLQISFGRNAPQPLATTVEDQQAGTVSSLTLLGVTLHHSLKWDTHAEGIIVKANTRNYFLVTLKRAGTTREQLVKFYISFIRPGLEYATPVWHPGISQTLSNNIDRVHAANFSTHQSSRVEL